MVHRHPTEALLAASLADESRSLGAPHETRRSRLPRDSPSAASAGAIPQVMGGGREGRVGAWPSSHSAAVVSQSSTAY